jgi:mono/diheme cytochrome c family protein
MSSRTVTLMILLLAAACCFAAADGSWLKKVPTADRQRVNPFAGDAAAPAAGKQLFENNCAKCHGKHAEGKGSRPSLISGRIAQASDGEIAWLLRNGNIYKGMPNWSGLPEQERWQIITYLRSLNTPTPAVQP